MTQGRLGRIGCVAVALLLLLAPRPARAQGANIGAAEAFFQEGRALYDAGKFAEACPKLAESHRLDPATGTLLTLALCHEGEGKLATAWAEFVEVEGRARREGRDDRVTIAAERAAAIKPRISTLVIEVPPEVAATQGLEVRLDGTAVGTPSFGVAMPIDGGSHKVEARAPDKTTWLGSISVKNESDAARIVVPALSASVRAVPPKQEPRPVDEPPAAPPPEPKQSGGWMSTAGLVTAGVGVVALGVGGYLALDAKNDYDEATKSCSGADHLDCPPGGPFEDANSAIDQGNVATVVMSVGGVVLAAGGTLWLLAPKSKSTKARTGGLRVERLGLSPRGVALSGRF